MRRIITRIAPLFLGVLIAGAAFAGDMPDQRPKAGQTAFSNKANFFSKAQQFNQAIDVSTTPLGFNLVAVPTAPTAALAGAGAGNLTAGNYSYKVTFKGSQGETLPGPASNVINVASPGTNGQVALTGIPVSPNRFITAREIYRTVSGGSTYFFDQEIANNTATTLTDNLSDAVVGGNYSVQTTAAEFPIYANITANSPGNQDSTVGIIYNTLGTTTRGGQFHGTVQEATGRHIFEINSVPVLELTDTYWNPNISYQGAPTAFWVLSSGALAGGPDNIVTQSVESSIYPGSATGLTEEFQPKGPTGEIHFTSNGLVGAVSIAAPNNPSGADVYHLANQLWFSGSSAGSGLDTLIYTQYNSADSTIGMSFYNEGSGGFKFTSNNTNSSLLQIKPSGLSDIQGFTLTGAATGSGPTIGVGSFNGFTPADTNIPINYKTAGTGSHQFYSGSTLLHQISGSASSSTEIQEQVGSGFAQMGAVDGGAASLTFFSAGSSSIYLNTNGNNQTQAEVAHTASAVDHFVLSGGAAGSPGVVTLTATGTDTNITGKVAGKGTGTVQLAGHVESALGGTSAPTCGTGCASITAGSTDTRGSFTTSASITASTLNFGTTWNATPVCVISDNSTAAVTDISALSTTVLTASFASSITSAKVYYICMQ